MAPVRKGGPLKRLLIAAGVLGGIAIIWSKFRGEVWHAISDGTETTGSSRVEGP